MIDKYKILNILDKLKRKHLFFRPTYSYKFVILASLEDETAELRVQGLPVQLTSLVLKYKLQRRQWVGSMVEHLHMGGGLMVKLQYLHFPPKANVLHVAVPSDYGSQ